MSSEEPSGLPAGKRLGHFEIVEAIGAGGMGQVYRAKDTRLGRDVAIKILPPELASAAGFRERFEREARTISSLNHPHICVLHDIGHDEGIDYLVMEYLEGESLAQRIEKGPLPLGELLEIAVQVADALDRAHRAGLVHRDLKPGNIMLSPAGAKLLDFGVAKSAVESGAASALTSSPTRTSPLTAQGAVVGTFQYMAPELFEGKEADARSDIFAFGTVLYEMAAGQRAFEGTTQAMVIAAILKDSPRRLDDTVPGLPRGLQRLIDACLVKNPERRRQSVHDLKLDLMALAEDSSAGVLQREPASTAVSGTGLFSGGSVEGSTAPGLSPPFPASGSEAASASRAATRGRGAAGRGPGVAASLVLAVTVAALAAWILMQPAPDRRVIRTSIPPPAEAAYRVAGQLAGAAVLSPDGTHVAFAARKSGRSQLYVRALDALEATPMAGTDGARRPFWSPDGKFIAFFTNSELKKVSVGGGPPLVVAQASDGRGGTWNEAGVIVFAPAYLGPLHRVSAAGGEVIPVTAGDETKVFTHRYPWFLPDGEHFLYLDRGSTSGAGDRPKIRVGSIRGEPREGKVLLEVASNAAYHDGHLLYSQGGTLLAVPFDTGTLEITGDAVIVASDVVFDNTYNHGAFTVSQNGMLAYHAGQASVGTRLVWIDREGKELEQIGEAGQFDGPVLSPDARHLAVARTNPDTGKGDIWLYDLEAGTGSRLTFDAGDDYGPLWSADGRRLIFTSARERGYQPYVKPADGSGAEEQILEWDGDLFPLTATPDGRVLVFSGNTPAGRTTLNTATDGEIATLRDLPADGTADLSPDGRWIAYVSNESGRNEVFIGSFPDLDARWQVSPGGGREPRWRDDGREIFYRTPDGVMMAVSVTTSERRVSLGEARALFQAGTESIFTSYDVAPDGQRFILCMPLQETAPQPLTLVQNWTAGLGN